MTIQDALNTEVGTDGFDAAVDFLADLCAAERDNREASRALQTLLQRNDDHCVGRLYA